MNAAKVGLFIEQLCKEQNISEEQLAEKLQVSEKKIAKWKKGGSLPPAECLQAMTELFSVSLNELLSGKRLSDEEYRAAAESNLSSAVDSGAFSLKDKVEFFEKKWCKDHAAFLFFLWFSVFVIFVSAYFLKDVLLCTLGFLVILLSRVWRHNAMMAYVERNAYDGLGNIK